MSQKRKYEEYHDPDYPQENDEAKKRKTSLAPELTTDQRADKVKTIIKREFQKEFAQKDQELARIEHKLVQSKRLLQRVRYAVVFNFYTKKNLEYSKAELQTDLTYESAIIDQQPITAALPVQKPIHPSLKKLLGKKPIDYGEILKIRAPRQAAKAAKTTISEKLRSKKDERKLKMPPSETVISHHEEMKIPRYIAPNIVERPIEKINTARGRHQIRHLIAVGNTSKYVGDEKYQNECTHKWLLYIKTKTDTAAIEDIVAKTRFFLHPSYQPNDVVEVDSSPFQISRLGWGEFPVRVQIYFHPHFQQKPVQIIHPLSLDKKLTGLQTMGAETLVEMWLTHPVLNHTTTTINSEEVIGTNLSESIANEATSNTGLPSKLPDKPTEKCEEKEEILSNTQQAKQNDSKSHSEPIVKQPIPVQSLNSSRPQSTLPNTNTRKLVKCLDAKGKVILVELQIDPNNPKNIKIIRNPDIKQKVISTQPVDISLQATNRTVSISKSSISNSPVTEYSILPTVSTANIIQPTCSSNVLVNSQNNISRQMNLNTANSILNSPGNPENSASIGIVKTPNKANSVILKNGKAFMIDANRLKSQTLNKPKQESLLKPQISLLKPKLPTLQASLLVQQSPSLVALKPNSSSSAVRLKMINSKTAAEIGAKTPAPQRVFMPYNMSADRTSLSQKLVTTNPRIDYKGDLAVAFYERNSFRTVRSAVEYLLKSVPFFNKLVLASHTDYSRCFPFVVGSKEAFNSFLLPKQLSIEWCRAKFIKKLVTKHKDLLEFPLWTTKEIVIFARQFGYTPPMTSWSSFIASANLSQSASNSKHSTEKEAYTQLSNLVKKEIKREGLNFETITSNVPINKWINQWTDERQQQCTFTNDNEEVINVLDDIDGSDEVKEERRRLTGKLWLPLENSVQMEGAWVADVCTAIQIKLKPEEIANGVVHPSAQRLLVQAVRGFVEDLTRRAYGSKSDFERTSDTPSERSVRIDDLRKTIATNAHFDFLTNKYLGVEPMNPPS